MRKKIQKDLEKLEDEICKRMHSESKESRDDRSQLKSEIGQVKEQVKSEIGQVKSEISQVTEEMKSFWVNQNKMVQLLGKLVEKKQPVKD